MGEAAMRETRQFNRQVIVGLVLITIVAAALRLYKLDYGSFWLDELYSINASAKLSDMHNSKALGYLPTVVGLHAAGIDPSTIPSEPATWQSLGITERVARLPTAIVGIATVLLAGLASVPLLGRRGALIVTLLLAIAPWHLYWSQAARFYIPQFLFYTLCIVFYFVATRDGSRRLFVAAMICLLLAFLSQPTALIILGVFAVDWLASLWRREPLKLGAFECITGATVVMLCLGIVGHDIWLVPSQWTQFVEAGVRHQSPLRMLLGAGYMIGPAVVAFAGLTCMGLWSRDRRSIIYFAAASSVPILTFAIMSGWAFVGLRYAFVALYGWLALAALGSDALIRVLQPRVGRALAWSPLVMLVASMALTNYIYFNSNGNFHARWNDAAAYVRSHREADEHVAASDVHTAEYYMQEKVLPLPAGPEQVRALDEVTWFMVEVTSASQNSGRHWLLSDAELRDVFPLRAAHGTSSLHVYRYVPRADDAR